ncbi:aspartate aminotransferase family protein [archaeon]|nr:aspartate aminotransferase family protein [archaeon]|tara:strand:+ start:2211 stop:3515 length:1305 start_codon:yes stop_codon:yes gene_type:complete
MSKYICKKPGKKSVDIIFRDRKVVSSSYNREYSFVFKKGKGMHLWDVDGRKYLDFAASVAVNSVGHANSEVIKAVKKQMKDGFHCAFPDFYAEIPVNFIENLLKFVPKHLNNVFLSNSGTESNECALKLAKWHTNKKWLIASDICFHGRSMGSLSMTNSKKVQRERFNPFLPVKHVPYPYFYRSKFEDEEDLSNHCLDAWEKSIKKLKKELAAVFLEPISGEGGYVVPPKSFVKGLRKACDKYDVLLVSDEIQAGCYRTGKFLAIENYNVKADIVSLSKAIGGGIPLGVTLANKKTMDWIPGSHSTTFGGNLLACVSGMATLNYMRKHKLGDNALKIGNYMMKRLNEMKDQYDVIGDVRGKGLMIGVEIVEDKRSKNYGIKERHSILCKASEKGLVLLGCGNNVIRMCPPLIINKKQADYGLDLFEDAVKDIPK